MIGTAGALLASAAIGVVGSLAGGFMQSQAADKATAAGKEATDKNIAESQRQYDTNRADLAPWRAAGEEALTKLKAGIADGSFDPAKFDYTKDPGYEFRMAEGTKAVERSAAARGNLFSGATGKALTQYGQDFASNEYDRAYARAADSKRTNYNVLAGVAGVGQQAVNSGISSGNVNTGNIIAANNNGANAAMTGAYRSGDAWSNAFSGVGKSLNTGIENYLLYKGVG